MKYPNFLIVALMAALVVWAAPQASAWPSTARQESAAAPADMAAPGNRQEMPVPSPAPAPPVAPLRLIEAAVIAAPSTDSAQLTSRYETDSGLWYQFRIGTHAMQVEVAHSGFVNVRVEYSFHDEQGLAECFPELKMDFGSFPQMANDGSPVKLTVNVSSNYEFANIEEFQNRLPRMFLHFDVLKDAEPTVTTSGIIRGGVTPRIIMQADENVVRPQQVIPVENPGRR